ncbi:Acyl-CoA reductase [Sinosporangium album]|uniref:Acyl-CoA reductase n=1 Tax=Sinosporangium album TaxID=504805 RepID=A0A1G8A799_9ACTN|nr:aldehyde dehydrogenase family protein [Sinosporangium album]SDH16855.1 Acyl-CoA reductase [Sinosporangium album]
MSITMTIDGRSAAGSDRLPVENPASGATVAAAPACDGGELDRAVEAARRAFTGWSRSPEERRRQALLDCGRVLEEHVGEISRLLTLEQGKPLRDAEAETRLAADWFVRTAGLTLGSEILVDDRSARIRLDRVPLGPVAAIAPSNFPLILAVVKVAPALLAGNTVVLKPSPLTPLATLRMGELLGAVLPPGTLNTIAGRSELGAWLVGHPGIRLVSFTGSVESGRAIARAASSDLKRVVLELGGNDPAIVLPGADVGQVAAGILRSALANGGQFCAAVKRVYVPRDLEAEFGETLGGLARRLTVGDGLDPATDLGPLVSEAQVVRVGKLVGEAVSLGARVLTGGRRLERPGHFYPPTVVTALAPGSQLEAEEQFGPVVPVLAYDSLEEAVERANATRFGLGGSVWGDEETAVDVAERLDCGTTWINSHGDLRHDVPFGGHKSSGIGVEYGYWGLLEYTQPRVVNLARVPL